MDKEGFRIFNYSAKASSFYTVIILSVYLSKSISASFSHQKLYVKPEDSQNSEESEEKFIA
jgi:hypothetical protein